MYLKISRRVAAVFVFFVILSAGLIANPPGAVSEEVDRHAYNEVFASDSQRTGNFAQGMVSNTSTYICKRFYVPCNPEDIDGAAVEYYIYTHPYDTKSRSQHSGPREGIEWSDLVVRVNDEIAASGEIIELATRGWHLVEIDPSLLKYGENRITMHIDKPGSYFYPAFDPTFSRGMSCISRNSGRTWDYENISHRTDRHHEGEFVIRLLLNTGKDLEGAFYTENDKNYLWLDMADLFYHDTRIEGWQAIKWTSGQNQPLRGLTAHAAGETEVSVPLTIPEEGRYNFWLRAWTDGFHEGAFSVFLVDDIGARTPVVDSRESGISFTSDANLKFEWLEGSSIELSPGSYIVNINTFGKCGHMFDVLAVTTDENFSPDDDSPLPSARYSKLFESEADFSDITPGAYLIEPHIRWGKPLLDGAVRSLWLAPHIDERDIVELARRIDMEPSVLSYHGNRHLGGGVFGGNLNHDTIEALRAALSGESVWDILVMVKIAPDNIPSDIQEMIEKRVEEGMGLLIVDSRRRFENEGFLARILGTKQAVGRQYRFMDGADGLLSGEMDLSEVSHDYGNGRIIIWPYMMWGFIDTPYIEESIHTMADRLYGSWGKLILAAAGRDENPLRISGAGAVPGSGGKTIEFELKNTGDSDKVAYVTMVIEGPSGERKTILDESPQPVGRREGSAVSVDLTGLATGGGHLMYLIASAEDGVSDFSMARFDVGTRLEIMEASPAKNLFSADEEISVNITIANHAPDTEDAVLELEAYGSFNRLIGRETLRFDVPRGESEQSFSLKTIPNNDWLVEVKAVLRPAGGDDLASVADCTLFVNREVCFDDVIPLAVVWERPWLPPQSAPAQIAKWHDFGIKSANQYHDVYAGYGMRYGHPYRLSSVTSGHGRAVTPSSLADGLYARVPCFHSPDFWEEEINNIERSVRGAVHLSPVILGIGDEQRLGHSGIPELCWSAHTVEAFREFLKEKYASLGDLNKAWDMDFESWDGIIPWTNEEAQKRVSNIAPWLEFREFMTDTFVDYVSKSQETVQNVDSSIPTGASNPWNEDFFTCVPYEKLFPILDVSYVYPRFFDQARSFFRDPRRAGTWTGYTRSAKRVAEESWLMPVYGGSIVGYYGLHREYEDWMSGAMKWTDRSLEVGSVIRELISGPGKLVMTAERKEPKIAVLKNYTSRYAHSVWRGAGSDAVDAAGAAREYNHLVVGYTRNLQTMGADYDFIDAAEFNREMAGKYSVIMAPGILALEDSLMDEITGYAADGGILVTDENIGIYTRSGSKREQRPVLTSGFENSNVIVMDPLSATEETLRPILERADALPEYRFEGGGRIRRATYKSFDEAELVILFGDGDFKVKFPGAAHVYDVRRQEYLGYSDESAVSTDSGPAIFALLPEAVSRITLNMPSRVARGEEAVFSGSVRAGRNPLNTVVHVSVFNPEGVAADAYEQNVKVKNGQIAGSFTTALNDEPGRWKIVATEVFSGMSYEREFQVF